MGNFLDIKQIISQPEGRRLEFKESLPEKSDLAKSIIAFSNDAGGDLYVGIKDKPREVVGISEEELLPLISHKWKPANPTRVTGSLLRFSNVLASSTNGVMA